MNLTKWEKKPKNLSVNFSVNTGIKRGALKYNLERKHSRCNGFWWISRD